MAWRRSALILILMLLLTGFGIIPVSAADTDDLHDGPKAVVSLPNAKFDAVVEGSTVSRSFTIANTGNRTLEIHQVLTG